MSPLTNDLDAPYGGSLDNKVHKLTVKIKKPGLTARARRSYLATPRTDKQGKKPGSS